MSERSQPIYNVRCKDCRWISNRAFRPEAMPFGVCTRCGGEMVKMTKNADRKAERAKRDLQAFDPEV